MALQSSPPISIFDIYFEFGAPAGTPITSFYRGGAYVPNTPQNAGVPASGPINLLNFLGATKYTPITVGITQTGGYVFQAEPAPTQRNVSGSLGAGASGGTGSYTYSWAPVSIPAGITWSASGSVATASGNVGKNSVVNVVLQLTVSDGTTSNVSNRTLRLEYETDF